MFAGEGAFGADDALGDGGFGGEEGAGDLVGGEAAEETEGEGCAGLGGQDVFASSWVRRSFENAIEHHSHSAGEPSDTPL